MKTMKHFLAFFAVAILLVTACEGNKQEVTEVASISLSGSNYSDGALLSGPDGGDFALTVTSSGDWTVSGLSEWATPSAWHGKNGETLSFHIDPNTGAEARTTTFKVFTADAVAAILITSSPSYVIALESDEAVRVGSDATSVNVRLDSNVADFDVDFGGASWLRVEDVSEGFGKKFLTLAVDRSAEFKAREAVVTISSTLVDSPVTLTLTQAQRDTVFVDGEQRIIKGLEAMDLDLRIKSNIDFSYSLPSWLSETSAAESALDEATGLKTKTVTWHADACGGSRASTVNFTGNRLTYGSVYVKQQNPNPIYANIPDGSLRSNLEGKGWILVDEGDRCEILEDGMTGTSLSLGSTSATSYSITQIASIEGLEKFPKLEELSLGSLTVETVDVSAYPALTKLTMMNLQYIKEINIGSRPIESVANTSGNYTYMRAKDVVIKGENVKHIDYSASNSYIGYNYESAFESIDVTGCPALETLNVNRRSSSTWYSGKSSLKYVYMTAAQQASVTVDKQDSVEIVVK